MRLSPKTAIEPLSLAEKAGANGTIDVAATGGACDHDVTTNASIASATMIGTV